MPERLVTTRSTKAAGRPGSRDRLIVLFRRLILPNDKIVLNIGGAAVPEPGTPMILSLLTGAGLLLSRRRRKVA
ncbi:MAG: PEP-CTERM sorting domain-containing protein [Pirellulaceae bacterium]